MNLKICLVLSIALIIVGCSNDEPASPVTSAEPQTNPTNNTDLPEPTPLNTATDPKTSPPGAPENQNNTPIIPPTELTPPYTEPNTPPVKNTIGMPDYSKHPYNPQEKIAGAVNIFAFSLANFDKEKYLSVLHGDELMINVATITMDYLTAFKNYENAYIDAYGLDEWNNFSTEPTGLDADTLLKNLALMEITQTGDHAVCNLPGSNQPPVHTIRIDNLWYINLSLMLPFDAVEARAFIDLHTKIIAMIQDLQSLIGKPDTKPLELNDEFSKRWAELIK